MLHNLLADLVLAVHLLFILFVIFGGLLLFWRKWAAWLHLPAVCWGFFIEASGHLCPLTPLENRLRAAAGEAGYAGGFIEHYLLPLVYPAGLTRNLQLFLAVVVLLLNVMVYGCWLYYRRSQIR